VILGLLSSAAGLAAAELVVGIVRGSASPVVPVGQEVIDRVSPSVKDWAIETFGTADKAVLVLGSLIVLAVIGSIVGLLAVRGHRTEAYIVALFTGLIGILAVLQRPAPTFGKTAPALVGTVVSIAALWWLSERLAISPRDGAQPRLAARAGDQTSTAPASSEPAPSRMGLNRRGFLYGAVTVGAASAVTAGFGRMLQRRFDIDDERAELALPPPSSSSPASGAPSSAAGEFDFGIDGISAFVTPVDEFYRIDTAIVVPQVSKDSWSLKIGGMVDHELELTFDDLLAREQVERYVTLSCVSNEVGGDLVGNGLWQGVMLADVLREAGIQAGAEQLVSRSIDGWTCGTPVAAITDGRDAMLAVGHNGQPLRAEHGYPVRMVVPGLYGYVSATKWVTEIELTTWDAFDAYWVPRGWAKEAPVKTMTRIDRPRRNRDLDAGEYEIGGVAWAVHRGISAVQVRIDGGEWLDAELAGVPSDDTWRQWRYTWPATPGEHSIEARAIDGAGAIQDEEPMSPAPNGAQGYHQVRVDVG
jgi:DMSO/TMAO reductase YedYZ molybdopterin-dependent catalytic subunit